MTRADWKSLKGSLYPYRTEACALRGDELERDLAVTTALLADELRSEGWPEPRLRGELDQNAREWRNARTAIKPPVDPRVRRALAERRAS